MLEQFRKAWPDVDVDIRAGLAFDALNALQREEVDLVISSDPEEIDGVEFAPLFDYSPVFVASAQHPLAAKPWVEAEDFRDEVLIAYPVDRSKLDVFKMLLMPAGVEPRAIRRVELTAVILLLVASQRGVTVLPDWVLRQVTVSSGLHHPADHRSRASPGGCIAATRSDDSAEAVHGALAAAGADRAGGAGRLNRPRRRPGPPRYLALAAAQATIGRRRTPERGFPSRAG